MSPEVSDSSWENALRVVHNSLHPSPALKRLVRNSWTATTSTQEFMSHFHITRLPASGIIRAARNFDPSIQDLESAVRITGVRYAASVAAIHFTCQEILRSGISERLWIPLLRDLMNSVEMGHHVGSTVNVLGPESGLLIGFAQRVGRCILLISRHQPDLRVSELKDQSATFWLTNYGCEPYQVSSLILQHLGFGTHLASTAATTLGNLAGHINEHDEITQLWSAANDWISCLAQGRRAPVRLHSQRFFPELNASAIEGEIATFLEILYSQIDAVRENNSSWNWHLPEQSYHETAAAIG
jgi:hypothetical protein